MCVSLYVCETWQLLDIDKLPVTYAKIVYTKMDDLAAYAFVFVLFVSLYLLMTLAGWY